MKILNQANRISFFVFFVFPFCICCRSDKAPASVDVVFQNDKATGLLLEGLPVEKNLAEELEIRLVQAGDRSPVLGFFKQEGKSIIFEPLVPFTRGLRYEVVFRDSSWLEVEIPKGNHSSPTALAIYPTPDTLPANLLKIYLTFSEPMVEGSSLNHIFLLKDNQDTMEGTFLDLHPELWNQDGTVLTLWLDPGRIKRDLIPNKQLGSPLKEGNKYTLHIADSWKSKKGVSLGTTFSKSFTTAVRDDVSPNPLHWKVILPEPNSKSPLIVQFQEPLDYFILQDGIKVLDVNKRTIEGFFEIKNEESVLYFLPQEPWKMGKFSIAVETRLEDICGNNIARPFDRDASQKITLPSIDNPFFSREFEIH